MNRIIKQVFKSGVLLWMMLVPALVHASHMIGGDITYRCLGGNDFEVTITLYQDCLYGEPVAIQQDNPAQYAIYTSSDPAILYTSGNVSASAPKPFLPISTTRASITFPIPVCVNRFLNLR